MCISDVPLPARGCPHRGRGSLLHTVCPVYYNILFEISVEKSLETSTVTSLILAHLVNSIVDCIKVLLLCKSSDSLLILASALLSKHPLLYVCLCVPDALSEKLCKLSCVLGLFPSISLECLGNFRISLSVSLTAHCKVHSHL